MKRRQDRWNFLFIAGMWFQDLFNYDFRRTEQCIIPYATQEGEISFCAYNTGVGWRNIIEKMHMTSTLTKWYEEHGRHEIFAGGKKVKMEDKEHALYLREEIVTHEVQHDLDKLGIAKTAREEKKRARDSKAESNKVKNDAAYDARMAQLYREVVLKEKPATSNEGGFIPLGAIVCIYFSFTRPRPLAILYATMIGGVLSFVIEVLQAYIPRRVSGTTDIITNTLGALVGAAIVRPDWIRTVLRAAGLLPSAKRAALPPS